MLSDEEPGAEASPPDEGEAQAESTETPGLEAVPPPRRRGIPFEFLLLFIPTLIVLSYLLAHVEARFETALNYPYQMDAEEGFVFKQAVDLQFGRPIYTPIEEEPYLIGNYPPLFPWALSKLMGRTRITLPFSRAVIAVCTLMLIQAIIMIVFTRTHRLLPSFLAPLLFLVTYEFHQWSAYCRVDIPALMLTGVGLLAFFASKARWATVLSALIFVAAAFTRQTAILAPVAIALALLIHDRRRLAWFILPYAAGGLGVFLLINARTDGQFYLHLVRYNRNAMNWAVLPRILVNEIWFFYRWWLVALAAGAVALVSVWAMKPDPAPADSTDPSPARFAHGRGVIGIYLILATLSLATFAKVGSAANYALEPLLAAALFGMITLGRLCDSGGGERTRRRSIARFGVVLMGLALIGHTLRLASRRAEIGRMMFSTPNPGQSDAEIGKILLDTVRSAGGDVLCEYPIYSILSLKDVVFQPFIMSRLAAEGSWDETEFLRDLQRRRFSLIITTEDLSAVERGQPLMRYTDAMARTIISSYRFEGRIGPGRLGQAYFIWLPAEAEDEDLLHQNIALVNSRPGPAVYRGSG